MSSRNKKNYLGNTFAKMNFPESKRRLPRKRPSSWVQSCFYLTFRLNNFSFLTFLKDLPRHILCNRKNIFIEILLRKFLFRKSDKYLFALILYCKILLQVHDLLLFSINQREMNHTLK